MIDSGNLWRCAISKDLMAAMGLSPSDLKPIPGLTQIGTAKEGASLGVLGLVKQPLRLKFNGNDTFFSCQPVVLEGLSMPFNISGPFLKEHSIDQLHSQDALLVCGQKIPLLATQESRPAEVIASAVYVSKQTVVPAFKEMWVPASVSEVKDGKMAPGDGIVMGHNNFAQKTDLHPWSATAVRCKEDGQVFVGVLNTLPHPITIPHGLNYGMFQRTTDSPKKHPHRIHLIGHVGYPGVQTPFLDKKGAQARAKQRQTDTGLTDLPEWMQGPTDDSNRKQRVAHLVERFKLNKSAALRDPEDLAAAAALLLDFWDTFSWDGSYGLTHLIEHTIKTPKDHPPINERYRPPNPALEGSLLEQACKWLRDDAIEPSQSPWNFALVAAKKKNGKIRWCVDYRSLNKITEKDTFPIGDIKDNLARLSRSDVYSTVDSAGAFHAIPLKKEDRPKTAFALPWGTFQFCRLPFGLCNGPSTYARLVTLVLAGLPWSVAIPYLDDCLVHSVGVKQHHENLRLVLQAHRDAGLRLQPDKCHFYQDQIDYLGHHISPEGISPTKDYLKVVEDWPLPTTRKETRTFLGKMGYYRQFIKGYAIIAKPLNQVLCQSRGLNDNAKFTPTAAFKETFE